MSISNPNSGYSLIEAAVVIVLISFLAGFAFHVIVSGMDIYISTTRDYLEIYKEGKIALEKIVREIRETDAHSIIISDSSISFTKKYGHGTPQDPYLDINFSLNENKLQRESGAVSRTLSEYVSWFTCSQDENGVVTVDLTVARGDNSVHLRTAVNPRQP